MGRKGLAAVMQNLLSYFTYHVNEETAGQTLNML